VSEASLIKSTSLNIEVIYEKKEDIMSERVAPAIMNTGVESNFLSNELENEAATVRKIGPSAIIITLTCDRSLSLMSILLSTTMTID
jgi:hypothetical protein